MLNHPREITDVYVSLFHVSYRCEHSPVFVRQSGFQSGDSVPKAKLLILRPHRVGQGFLYVRSVRVNDIDYRFLFSLNEKGREAAESAYFQLRVKRSHGFYSTAVVPARFDEDVHILRTPRPARPSSDAV